MAEYVRPPGSNAYFTRRETQERNLAADGCVVGSDGDAHRRAPFKRYS